MRSDCDNGHSGRAQVAADVSRNVSYAFSWRTFLWWKVRVFRQHQPTVMATGSPGEAEGVDLDSSGGVSDDDNSSGEVVALGGDTDDEIPDGENFFGRSAKQGAAPAGANPFAASSTAPEDDWAAQIAEAKAQVEVQRKKREVEELIEKEKEKAAAELKGKVYEERRKAGDPAPEATTNSSGAHGRVRKMLKARRPTGGGDDKKTSSPAAAPFSFGGSLMGDTKPAGPAASPFAGFLLLPTEPGNTAVDAVAMRKQSDKPKDSGSIFSRLSGAPAPFEPVVEEEEESGEESDEEKDETPVPAVPLFTGCGSVGDGLTDVTKSSMQSSVVPVARPSFLLTVPHKNNETTMTPVAPVTSSNTPAKARTPLAIELDL